MKNELTRHDIAVRKDARQPRDARVSAWTASRCVRLGLVGSLGASLALMLNDTAPRAQQRYTEPAVKVTSVTTSGNVVSISADGSLGRAQTWQDPEGFHVVLVNGQAAAGASSGGVRTRRVGNSLELVVPVRRGASVTVEPRGNRLDLVVSGGQGGALNVENFPVEQHDDAQTRARSKESAEREPAPRQQEEFYAPQPSQRRRNEAAQPSSQQSASPQQFNAPPPAPNATAAPVTAAQPQSAAPSGDVNPSTVVLSATQPDANASGVPAAQARLESGGGGFNFLSFLTSVPALFLLAGALVAGAVMLFLRRRRDRSDLEETAALSSSKNRDAVVAPAKVEEAEASRPFKHTVGDRRKLSVAVPFERRTSGRGSEDSAMRQLLDADAKSSEGFETTREGRSQVAAPAVQFGAYRIDQEVAALVQGKPHTLEVIASRAADDRRAVETSLLKALRSHELDADGRRRARTALEDYGFVARSCASLILGSESFERASAARSLGEMRSPQALPFLTEALYDQDSVVRNECVQSLGTLGLPSAIGALLDVARRHPDLSAGVLGPALTACSVESLELSWNSPSDGRTPAEGLDVDDFSPEIVAIMPAESYEELPDFIKDVTLESALERAGSEYPESRVVAAQNLAQF